MAMLQSSSVSLVNEREPWQANMDIQFVLNAYSCIMYIASYIVKTERSMGELLKLVADEADLKSQ